MRPRLRRRAGAVLLAPVAACLLAACGGGGNEEDARQLLDKAFSHEIRSADLELEAQVQVRGSKALDRPIRIRATGPYRSNQGKLPALDLDFRVNAGGGGQTVETGFVSTGNRSFIKFQGVYYEQPASEVDRTNRLLGRGGGRKSSLKALGLDPRSWLRDAKEEGTEDVAGVETRHVSGKLDVQRLVRDFNGFVRRSGKTIAGAAGGGPVPEPLSDSDVKKVADVVEDPTFDVYVGKEDEIVRRVSGRLELDVPERDRDSVGGIEGGSVQFSLEFGDVNGDQRIEAPAKARPLSDLTRSLGTGALGGGTGGGSGGAGGGGGGAGGGSGGGTQARPPSGSTPDAEAFKDYAECLDKAKPQDTQALQRCSELLR